MTVAKTLLLGLLFCALHRAQLTATNNAQAKDIQDKRDYWCGISNAYDNRYNSSQRAYYRAVRQTIYSDNVYDAFLFYNQYDSTRWIQTMRWATGLLIVLVILALLSWFIWLGFCCASEERRPSQGFMRFCLILAIVCFVLFLGLFVVNIIFIAHSEVSQRRAKCQFLNIGSMLINGYRSQFNGNQYVGLLHYSKILNNLQVELPNLVSAIPSAATIVSSTSNYWATSAYTSLGDIYRSNWQKTTVGPLRETTQGDFLANLTPTVSPAIGIDFLRLSDTSNYFTAAAQAIPDLSNSGNSATVSNTIGYLNSNIASMVSDLSDLTLNLWNRGWTRYTFATGAYWAIFAVSIVLIILLSIIIAYLCKVWRNDGDVPNRTAFKVILGLAGFFVVWYGILVIILLAGSTSIATFCTVLGKVNEGQVQVLDSLPVNWENNRYGLSRQIIKHCVVSSSGDLLDFANTFTNSGYSVDTAKKIKDLIKGLVAYRSFINGPIFSNGSPALSVYNAQLNAVNLGVVEDGAGVFDQDIILSKYINSTNYRNSITTGKCSIQSSVTNCLNDDVLNSWNVLPSFTDSTKARPYYDNLQAYILSEQSAVSSISAQLNTGVGSSNYKYTMANSVLAQNQDNYNRIVSFIPGTDAILQLYRGGLSAYDCRRVRREMFIFEDHLCFELNYWVNILTVLSAISFCLLFVLCWALFSAARHTFNGEPIVAAIPAEPAKMIAKEDPALDINDREIIPSM